MKTILEKLSGVCAESVEIKIDGALISEIKFNKGCSGMGQALTRLTENHPVETIIKRLKNIKCGKRKTSCPDQVARILEDMI